MRRIVYLCVLASLLLMSGTAYAQKVQLSIDYVDIEEFIKKNEIRLFFDLLDSDYKPVSKLETTDIEVFAGDEKLEGVMDLEQFKDTNEAVAILILMGAHMNYAAEDIIEEEGVQAPPSPFELQREGVINFIKKLGDSDVVALYTYNESRTKMIGTWSEKNKALSYAEGMETPKKSQSKAGTPKLYKFIGEMVELVAENDEIPRRRIIVVITDGLDKNLASSKGPAKRIEAISESIKENGIMLMAVGFSPGFQEPLKFVDDLCQKVDGVYRDAKGTEEYDALPSYIEGIADQIQKQYILSVTSEDMQDNKMVQYLLKVKTGGSTVEAIYDEEVKLPERPTAWLSILKWVGIIVGGILVFFILIIVIIKAIKNRGARQEEEYEEEEYVGPSKGKLTCNSGDFAGKVFHLVEDLTTIGSLEGNAIWIPDPSVSKRHAGIKIDEMRYELADFGSTNGTYIEGKKITKQFLKDGDSLQIGNIKFTFNLK